MRILVIYDISDNKKRHRAAKILNGNGTRVQDSAFECIITEARIAELERKLSQLIDKTDSVRFYRLSANSRISVYGTASDEVFSSSSFLVI